MTAQSPARPADFCAYQLAQLDAIEARRKRRARDTTPDSIGLGIKRDLLSRAIAEQPAPETFEAWLLEQVITAPAGGPVHALATEILAEYHIAIHDPTFAAWLAESAAGTTRPGQRRQG
jgi:hypothetical protein